MCKVSSLHCTQPSSTSFSLLTSNGSSLSSPAHHSYSFPRMSSPCDLRLGEASTAPRRVFPTKHQKWLTSCFGTSPCDFSRSACGQSRRPHHSNFDLFHFRCCFLSSPTHRLQIAFLVWVPKPDLLSPISSLLTCVSRVKSGSRFHILSHSLKSQKLIFTFEVWVCSKQIEEEPLFESLCQMCACLINICTFRADCSLSHPSFSL